MLTLTVIAGPEAIGSAYALEEGTHLLGRANPPCAIVLNGTKISKRHCAFEVYEGKLSVKDLKSSNGVYVNGEKISEKILKNKDRVVVGEYLLEVKVET